MLHFPDVDQFRQTLRAAAGKLGFGEFVKSVQIVFRNSHHQLLHVVYQIDLCINHTILDKRGPAQLQPLLGAAPGTYLYSLLSATLA